MGLSRHATKVYPKLDYNGDLVVHSGFKAAFVYAAVTSPFDAAGGGESRFSMWRRRRLD